MSNPWKQEVAAQSREKLERLVARCKAIERTKGRVEAIKVYRQESGASLKSAIEALK